MKKSELLLDVIGEVQDRYLEELDAHLAKVKSRKIRRNGLLIAACLCLVVGAVVFGWYRLAFGGGSCSYAIEGITAGGYFYYEVPGDGFFRYTPGEGSVRLTRENLVEKSHGAWYFFTANDYGFYYTKGDWIYRIRHGSTKSERFYRYDCEVSNPYMYPAGATDIAVNVHCYPDNENFHTEIFILDGITGERKTTIMEQDYSDAALESLPYEEGAYKEARDAFIAEHTVYAEKVTYTVGGRTLELILDDNGLEGYSYKLTENGEPLVENYAEPYDVRTTGDSLIFTLGRAGANIGYDAGDFLIVSPDGSQTQIKACPQVFGGYGFTDRNTYDWAFDWSIIAVRLSDGEEIELMKWAEPEEAPVEMDVPIAMNTDGKYMWLTYYDRISCYLVEYENGVPTVLTLIDDDIIPNN